MDLADAALRAFLAVAGFALVVAAAALFGGGARIRDRLGRDPSYRERVAGEFEAPKGSRIYLGLLDDALSGLDRLMGPLQSDAAITKGLGVCVALALVYTSLFLIFGWGVLGASGQIGPFQALPASGPWAEPWVRALTGIGVCLYLALVWAAPRRVARVAIVVGVAALPVIIAAFGAIAAAIFAAGVLAAAVLARAGAAVADAAIVAALAIGVLVFVLGHFGRFGEKGFLVLLLWVALPFANALPNLIAWWVSRDLGRRLQAIMTGGRGAAAKVLSAALLVLLGLVAGVLCFELLAWLMPRIARAVNDMARWAESDLVLPLFGPTGLVCRTAQDPWGEGVWPTLMLSSTLVPSALHAGMVLLAPFALLWLKWFRDPGFVASLRRAPAGEGGGGSEVGPVIDAVASRQVWAWYGAMVTTTAVLALLWLGLDQAWPALPWLDQALELFTRATLWVAYAFDWPRVDACLGPL